MGLPPPKGYLVLEPFHNLRARGDAVVPDRILAGKKETPMPLSTARISDLFYQLFLGHNTSTVGASGHHAQRDAINHVPGICISEAHPVLHIIVILLIPSDFGL